MKPKRKPVDNDKVATPKIPGGITGKGFLPGQSGNPGGRPKRRPITEALLEALMADEGKLLNEMAAVGAKKAAGGDIGFWREIREAIEGKSPLPLVGPDEGPMSVSADVDDRLEAVVGRLRARAAERRREGVVPGGAWRRRSRC